MAWFRTFAQFLQAQGWRQSVLDPCLFTLHGPGPSKPLVGVCIIHVDDIGLAGEGPLFKNFVRKLKERFTFRKWRRRSGTFVGA